MTYPLTGQVDFPITFEYLARKFIQVSLIGRDRLVLTLNNDYRFSTRTQITTNRSWTTSDDYQYIEIRRVTSATERLVDFADGSILRAYDLNIAQIQAIHIAEEARDLSADTIGVNEEGNLDARGRRIVNLADPVNDYDAINLHTVKVWNESALNSMNEAKQAATDSWKHSENSWKHSKSAWEASESAWQAAKESKQSSDKSEDSAKQSARYKEQCYGAMETCTIEARRADAAGWRADAAQGGAEYAQHKAEEAAERATIEANKLGNWNGLAGTIDYLTDDKSVFWKSKSSAPTISAQTNLNLGYDKPTYSDDEPAFHFNYSKNIYCGSFYCKRDRSVQYNGNNFKFNSTVDTGNLWSKHITASEGFTMSSGGFYNHAGSFFVADKPIYLNDDLDQVPAFNIRNGEENRDQSVYTYLTSNKHNQELSYDISINNRTQTNAIYRFTQNGLQVDKNINISQGKYSATLHDNGDITCNSNGIWEGGVLSTHIKNVRDRSIVDVQLGGTQSFPINENSREMMLTHGQVLTGIGWIYDGRWRPKVVNYREVIVTHGDGSWRVIKAN